MWVESRRSVDQEVASTADKWLTKTVSAAEATSMLPTGELFVRVYVLIDDLIAAGAIVIPPRWGPDPKCGDAELLTTAMVRHLLGRRSEAGCLAGVARDWPHLFPRLPHQSQAIVPAAVNERDVAEDLLEAGPPPREKGNRYLASITGETAVAAAV
jgi:hypothetical protein